MIHILEIVGIVLAAAGVAYILIMVGCLIMLAAILNLFWGD